MLCFVSQTIVRPTLKVVLHPGHCATAFARTQAIANKVSGHLPQHHLKWKPDSHPPSTVIRLVVEGTLTRSTISCKSKAAGSILALSFLFGALPDATLW